MLTRSGGHSWGIQFSRREFAVGFVLWQPLRNIMYIPGPRLLRSGLRGTLSIFSFRPESLVFFGMCRCIGYFCQCGASLITGSQGYVPGLTRSGGRVRREFAVGFV